MASTALGWWWLTAPTGSEISEDELNLWTLCDGELNEVNSTDNAYQYDIMLRPVIYTPTEEFEYALVNQ